MDSKRRKLEKITAKLLFFYCLKKVLKKLKKCIDKVKTVQYNVSRSTENKKQKDTKSTLKNKQ